MRRQPCIEWMPGTGGGFHPPAAHRHRRTGESGRCQQQAGRLIGGGRQRQPPGRRQAELGEGAHDTGEHARTQPLLDRPEHLAVAPGLDEEEMTGIKAEGGKARTVRPPAFADAAPSGGPEQHARARRSRAHAPRHQRETQRLRRRSIGSCRRLDLVQAGGGEPAPGQETIDVLDAERPGTSGRIMRKRAGGGPLPRWGGGGSREGASGIGTRDNGFDPGPQGIDEGLPRQAPACCRGNTWGQGRTRLI